MGRLPHFTHAGCHAGDSTTSLAGALRRRPRSRGQCPSAVPPAGAGTGRARACLAPQAPAPNPSDWVPRISLLAGDDHAGLRDGPADQARFDTPCATWRSACA